MCYFCCSIPMASMAHPTWRSFVLPPPQLPEHCCWMSSICSRTIFIASFLCLKISPDLYNQIQNLPSRTRSCLNLPWFHLCALRSHYFQTGTSILTLCFSLKCPLPRFFLDLNITDLARTSSSPMSFHEARHSHSGPQCRCLLRPSAYVDVPHFGAKSNTVLNSSPVVAVDVTPL